MEEQKTLWEYVLLVVVTIPLGIALVIAAYRQFKERYLRDTSNKRW